jgi:signal transduction histidine kinase
MREALFVCARDGSITPIRSRATVEWFGVPSENVRFWDYLIPEPSPLQLTFKVGFEQLSLDQLPFEVNACQMPKVLKRNGRIYELDYQQLMHGNVFAEVLVIASDVTAQVNQERAERINRELPVIVGHLLRDRVGFQDFVSDTEHALSQLPTIENKTEQRRVLHTLKGNTAIYGMSHFASRCHLLEDLMLDDLKEPTAESMENLVETWEESLASVGVFLTNDTNEPVQIARNEYDDLLNRIANNEDYYRLLTTARTWVHPPLSKILEIQVSNARQLARRFGKEVNTEIVDHGLRLPAGSLRAFFANLVHVVRNAVDHGIEEPANRVTAGKPKAGRIVIETKVAGEAFGVIVSDDGRGIDWNRVRKNAARMNLPVATEQDLITALGVDGLTTKDAVTDVSGRGVGMSAVYRSCSELGGSYKVFSKPGEGTRFEFWFAFDAIKYSLIPSKDHASGSGVHRSVAPIQPIAKANNKS